MLKDWRAGVICPPSGFGLALAREGAHVRLHGLLGKPCEIAAAVASIEVRCRVYMPYSASDMMSRPRNKGAECAAASTFRAVEVCAPPLSCVRPHPP
ncbi:hypothetical protein J2X36_000791 [Methylobacterium sp. BE186]|nr:hypothetical protein [Methylobacterium sp. BE186]